MPKGGKVKYTVDDLNRLIVKKDDKHYPLEGEFKIRRNDLIFKPHRKSPLARQLSLPETITFQGSWYLTQNHDLGYSFIEEQGRNEAQELEIKGRIISCEGDNFVFETRCKKTPWCDKITLLRLSGRWQANELNELNFLVDRNRQEDVLRFKGAWKVNRGQEIVYTYEKQGRGKAASRQSLGFKGYWQINAKDNLSYVLDIGNNSLFEFKAQLQRPNLKGDRRQIKYRIGIGAKKMKRERIFSLFGSWRVTSRNNILFQVDYGHGRMRALVFGASVFLNDNDELVFELKNRRGEPLGLSVAFERGFLNKKARLFTRLFNSRDARRLEAGLKIPW